MGGAGLRLSFTRNRVMYHIMINHRLHMTVVPQDYNGTEKLLSLSVSIAIVTCYFCVCGDVGVNKPTGLLVVQKYSAHTIIYRMCYVLVIVNNCYWFTILYIIYLLYFSSF